MAEFFDRDRPNQPPASQLSPAELQEWQRVLEAADRNNIWCHCRICDREWIASAQVPCSCGSRSVEYIACWQFPDD